MTTDESFTVTDNNASTTGQGTSDVVVQIGQTMLGNTLLMGITILRPFLIARLLGPIGKGELVAITTWPGFLIVIGSLGLPDAILYFSSKRSDTMNIVKTSLLLMAPLAVLTIGVGYVTLPWFLQNQSPDILAAARLYLLVVPLGFLTLAAQSTHRSLGRFDLWNTLRLIKPSTYIIGVVIAWMLHRVNAVDVAAIYLVLNVFATVFIVSTLRRYGSVIRAKFASGLVGDLVKYGSQSALSKLPLVLNQRLDQVVIIAFMSAMELGLYTTAYAWSIFLLPMADAVTHVMFPYIAQANDPSHVRKRFAQSFQAGALIAVFLCLGVLLITPVAFTLVYGAAFEPALTSAYVLVIAAMIWQWNKLLQAGLNGAGYPIAGAISDGISLTFTIVLLWVLLPKYGIFGAAIASLCAYTVSFVVLLAIVRSRGVITLRDIVTIDPALYQRSFRTGLQYARRKWTSLKRK